MRLDVYLAEKGLVKSRELARKMIKDGGVLVNDKPVTKPAGNVSENDRILIIHELPEFVGRGGYKLKGALKAFDIDVNGLVCADIGASTGGFTDCLLKNGARLVYAVDVGHGQLDPSLEKDSRVVNMEGMNIRNASLSDFAERIDFICTDVSFISLTLVIPKLSELISEGCGAVMLVKPQFECGKGDIGKGGIVRSVKAHARALKNAAAACEVAGLGVKAAAVSPIHGGDGNIEFLLYAVKGAASVPIDLDALAKQAQNGDEN